MLSLSKDCMSSASRVGYNISDTKTNSKVNLTLRGNKSCKRVLRIINLYIT